jgi:hypothetical protein
VTARPQPRGSAPAGAAAPTPAAPAAYECRCGCGSLLARLRSEGVELKCRRCKRVVTLSFASLAMGEVAALHPVP